MQEHDYNNTFIVIPFLLRAVKRVHISSITDKLCATCFTLFY